MNAKIDTLRKRIDAMDRALVRLLGRRAQCSLEIGRMKKAAGLRLFSHARERQIAENVRHANRGPLPNRALTELYSALLRLTRRTVRDTLRLEARAHVANRKRRKHQGRK